MDIFLAASVFDYTPEEKASASKNKVAKNKEEKKKDNNQKKKGSIFDDPTDPTPMKDKKPRPSLRRECPIGVWVLKLRETPKGPPHRITRQDQHQLHHHQCNVVMLSLSVFLPFVHTRRAWQSAAPLLPYSSTPLPCCTHARRRHFHRFYQICQIHLR